MSFNLSLHRFFEAAKRAWKKWLGVAPNEHISTDPSLRDFCKAIRCLVRELSIRFIDL